MKTFQAFLLIDHSTNETLTKTKRANLPENIKILSYFFTFSGDYGKLQLFQFSEMGRFFPVYRI